MSILDDLKTEAEQQYSKLNGYSSIKEKQQQDFLNKILPKMQYIYSYFSEVFEYLSVIEKPIEVSDYCRDFPAIGELQQSDFSLTTDKHGGAANLEKLKEVNLNYYLKGSTKLKGKSREELSYTKETKLDVEKENRFLNNNNIPFRVTRSLKSNNENAVTFHISRTIPVTFKFLAEPENSSIVLQIINHQNFDSSTRSLKPEEINEAYLEKVASFLLRKSENIIVNKMDESSKEKIRRKVKNEKAKKELQLEIAKRQEELKLRDIENQKFGSKVKSFFKNKFS